MNRWKSVILTLILGLVDCRVGAVQAAINDALDATCRITAADGSCGTGCVFEITGGTVYVLTAAHLVSDSPTVQCEFWKLGHQSQPLAGRVTACSRAADAAVVSLAEAAFAGVRPAVILLAPRDYVVRPGETLTSVGCASGAWATGWMGHAIGGTGGEARGTGELRFVPAPANGRSGSAIFDAEARQIVGLVRARTGDSAEGIATTVQDIYRAFDAPANSAATLPKGTDPFSSNDNWDSPRERLAPIVATQCGPGGCPARPQTWQNHVLPYRNRHEGEQSPYPTLPAPAPVDLRPVEDKLAKITELLGELKGGRSKSAAADQSAAPDGVATDPQARKMAQDALQTAGQAADAARAAQAETVKVAQLAEGLAGHLKDVAEQTNKLGAAQEKTNAALQKHGTLGERLEMLKQRVEEKVGEDASRPEKVRAFIHEAVTDKTEWLRVGLLAALALPLLIFVLDYAHHRKSGDPLLLNKLATQLTAAAAHQPLLAPAANVASHAATDVTGLLALLSQHAQAQRAGATPPPTP
jgi:hypothetical protein